MPTIMMFKFYEGTDQHHGYLRALYKKDTYVSIRNIVPSVIYTESDNETVAFFGSLELILN